MIRAVLCDIEGTTSSLAFVHDVLFPISRRKMDSFIREHWNDPDLQTEFEQLKTLAGGNAPEDVISLLLSWIDADKKEGALKKIQGKIWRSGFENGEIRAHIYPDVPAKWRAWKDAGLRIYIFSSGSVEAQQLLFRYTEAGDLTGWIDGYFDTATGPKREPESYRKIAWLIDLKPYEILFLSDVAEELDAAKTAGMRTVQIDRSGQITQTRHPLATSFDQNL